jgi:HD superfamily phosphodiesterase
VYADVLGESLSPPPAAMFRVSGAFPPIHNVMAAEGRPDTLKLSTELAAKALERAKVDVAGNDGSHDAFHLERVVRLAQVLAREESFEDLELVEIAAAMHDLKVRIDSAPR